MYVVLEDTLRLADEKGGECRARSNRSERCGTILRWLSQIRVSETGDDH
jgi:hypothetical protein